MRRDRSVVPWGVALAVVLAGAASCQPPAETPPAASQPAAMAQTPIDVSALDIFSGCERGALQVKVLIHLRPTDAGACRPEVTPASVCVKPGGRVDFKVESDCQKPTEVALTVPTLKRKLDGSQPPADEKRPVLPGCDLKLRVGVSDHCTAKDGSVQGYYKYDVYGDGIERLDPDIEVRN